jgi:formyl-CoA transferase/CoA:oxalate CoA-transferase
LFKAKDKHIILAVGTERLWQNFCEALGLDGLKADERFATNALRNRHRAALTAMLDEFFAGQPADYWLDKLRTTGIPAGPINSIADTVAHAQHLARNFIVDQAHPTVGTVKTTGNPVRLSETPVTYRLPPPRLGEHTAEILAELGYDEATITTLNQQGVV